MRKWLDSIFQRIFKLQTDREQVTLSQRRIYILPTGQGLAFLCVIVLMLLGAINYNLSLGYLLTFFIAMISVLSMFYAFRNLAQLQINITQPNAVFCGEKAWFKLQFITPQARYHLHLKDSCQHCISFDLIPEKQTHIEIPFAITSTQRGKIALGRLKLYTEFPLGLFHAWSYLNFDAHCFVYPKPLVQCPEPNIDMQDEDELTLAHGDEEFIGLRKFQHGDTLIRVDWKAFSRERGLLVKQFSTPQNNTVYFNLQHTPFQQLEQQLSCLTRWLLDAEQQNLVYGLTLEQVTIPPAQGSVHLQHCLQQLALFKLDITNE